MCDSRDFTVWRADAIGGVVVWFITFRFGYCCGVLLVLGLGDDWFYYDWPPEWARGRCLTLLNCGEEHLTNTVLLAVLVRHTYLSIPISKCSLLKSESLASPLFGVITKSSNQNVTFNMAFYFAKYAYFLNVLFTAFHSQCSLPHRSHLSLVIYNHP